MCCKCHVHILDQEHVLNCWWRAYSLPLSHSRKKNCALPLYAGHCPIDNQIVIYIYCLRLSVVFFSFHLFLLHDFLSSLCFFFYMCVNMPIWQKTYVNSISINLNKMIHFYTQKCLTRVMNLCQLSFLICFRYQNVIKHTY